MSLACDLRIAADHVKLCLPEAKRGMGANYASVLLPRMIPRGIAMQTLDTAEPITAQEALHWGLVNKVVPFAELASTVETFARALIKNAPLTLQRYKHMAVKGWELPVSSALRLDAGPNPSKRIRPSAPSAISSRTLAHCRETRSCRTMPQ